jgi:hypothetical protein
MDKSQVAEVLEEIALLLDLQGENPFGVAVARRAGVPAADVLNTLPAARLDEALRRRR